MARTGLTSTNQDADLRLGSIITLPAGGPWIIHQVWGACCVRTPLAGQGFGANLTVDSVAGDINPDPAPAKYPLVGFHSPIGTVVPPKEIAVNMYDVNWTAAGKAQLEVGTSLNRAVTTAGVAAAGIIFSDTIPVRRPLQFVDTVDLAITAAGETDIGEITISEKATKIVGVMGMWQKVTAFTASEPINGFFSIDSNDVKFKPAQFPMTNAIGGGLGAMTGASSLNPANFIPVDIPVIGGSIINLSATLHLANTGNVNAAIYIAYE